MKQCVNIVANTTAFKKLGAKMFTIKVPGCEKYEIYSDNYLRCLARNYPFNVYHSSDTCKMGDADDETTVVDRELKVKGIKNLRVVDGSVMPTIPSGNTNAPIIMIGEKASEMIRNENPDMKNPESQRENESKDRGFNVKLPKLKIENFTGNPQEWTEFWNSFETTIHENNVLSKVEKLSCLKMYLSGKALNVVSGFELSSKNYDNCIKILKDRFGRKDVIISSYMNKIINIELERNSSNLNALRRLYDDLITSARNLDTMSVTSGSYSCMLISMVLKKIPYNMVLEYNREKGSKSEVEVSELLDYIESEVKCRESSNLIINGNQSELASSPRKSFESKKYVHTERLVAATLGRMLKFFIVVFAKMMLMILIIAMSSIMSKKEIDCGMTGVATAVLKNFTHPPLVDQKSRPLQYVKTTLITKYFLSL
ncbi:Glucose dehydrogenase [FAD, quinone] [Araneus ventricosus]|uniref:Glucose dehydrogenase [FAD, quinone] n=1 Tax=Araneus ventricosus TaxID=182803 RepID=A0A4Y2J6V8_ARAVE|nr:Glucose dehydrogenase [FAD, quinone] [Araneus ventricosus]